MSLAERVVAALQSAGMREAVVCPGGRNAELIAALTSASISLFWHFEERSAAFFALGRARSTNAPVAVVTTSGTAAGELLPAVMEAAFTGTPLVALTADRPRRFRGTGAPQSAYQTHLFQDYAPHLDLEDDEEFALAIGSGPIHINVCLNDPNRARTDRDTALAFRDAEAFLSEVERPLVIVGTLAPADRPSAIEFLLKLGAPVVAEATSGLRAEPMLDDIRLHNADGVFRRAEFDGVIRIGGVPTHRLWRDLEETHVHLPVLSFSRLPFSGLSRASTTADYRFPDTVTRCLDLSELRVLDRARWQALQELLIREPQSEPGLVFGLSQRIQDGAHVYLGNSLPIREWDLAADPARQVEITASRGLNGIDGQVSTFLGECRPTVENWAVLGDLTALYDLAGPWIASQLPKEVDATLVVIHNSGGRIFERMFTDRRFLNNHDRSFEHWSHLWDAPYFRCHNPANIVTGPGFRIVEMRPDPLSTDRFWKEYEALV